MSTRSLTSILITVLCISLMMLAYLARQPLCIDSNLVDRLDRVDKHGTASMYSCRYHKHVPYHPVLAAQSGPISSVLHNFESYFSWIGSPSEPVSITSFEGKTNLIRIQGRQIFLGEDLVSQKNVLDKVMAKIWLREISQGTPFEKPLYEEVFTDFIIYAMNANLQIFRSESSVDLDQTHYAKWPQSIQTLRGYCQSFWKATEDLQLCDALVTGKDGKLGIERDEANSLVSLSLRPLLTQSLVASYEKLGSEDKLRFLKSLRSMVSATKVIKLPTIAENNLATMTADIEMFVSLLKFSVQGYEVADFLTEELKARGFNPGYEYSSVDTLFILDDSSNGFLQDISQAAAWRTDLNIAIETKDEIYFANEMQPIPRRVLNDVRAIRGVWLTCGLPKTYDILKFDGKLQKLLIVDACSKKAGEQINFHSYVQSGVEAFARVNQSVNFISLHVPSLKMALNHSKQSPVELILSQLWRGMKIQNLAWQNPSFDPKLNAFRMSSQIDAIDLFRVR